MLVRKTFTKCTLLHSSYLALRHCSNHANLIHIPYSGLVLLDIRPELLVSLDTDFLAGVQLVVTAEIHVTLEQWDHVTVETVVHVNSVVVTVSCSIKRTSSSMGSPGGTEELCQLRDRM